MKDIFQPETARDFIGRIELLSDDSKPMWGKMKVAQMIKHCNDVTEITFGERKLKRPFISKLIGKLILKKSIGNDNPLGHNKPTHPDLIVKGDYDFENEKSKLIQLVSQYPEKDPSEFENREHPFFGKMKSDQWNKLIYKHLDHHLSQFGV